MNFLDGLIVAAFVILALIGGIGMLALKSIPKWIWVLIVVAGTLCLGFVRHEAVDAMEREKERQFGQAAQLVNGLALEIERLGTAGIARSERADSTEAAKLADLSRFWFSSHGSAKSVQLLIPNAVGETRTVFSAGNGSANSHGKGSGGESGSSSAGPDGNVVRAMRGLATPRVEGPVEGENGTVLAVYRPLTGAKGESMGVLFAEVSAAGLEASIQQATALRLMKYQLIGSAMLMVLAVILLLHLSSRNAVYRKGIQASRQERVRFENLVDSINSIVWEADAQDLRYTFVSKLAAKTLGYDLADWLSGPGFREKILHPEDSWAVAHCRRMILARKPYELDYRVVAKDGSVVWLRESGRIISGADGRPALVRGVLSDITNWKEVNEEMEKLNRTLLDASRSAGMAEVATSVLHNVGNVLNSISVSSTIIAEKIRGSKVEGLRKAALMIREKNSTLGEFLADDPKGRLIPEYIDSATRRLSMEHTEVVEELSVLLSNIEHVKEIVSMQQSIAGIAGVLESIHPGEIVDEALRMSNDKLVRNRIETVSHACLMPSMVKVDRHKVLQILINLIQNAIHAMEGVTHSRRLTFRIGNSDDGKMVAIHVEDNGIGISPDCLTDIFRYGFTTKKDGHGFGLHSAANFAREIGGSLTAHSAGPGMGAEFVLQLPTS